MTIKRIKKQYINILKTNTAEGSGLEFRLRKIDEIKNYLSEEIKSNDLMSEKYKKTCNYLNYVENLLLLVSTVTDCVQFLHLLHMFVRRLVLRFCSRNKHLRNHCSN